MIVSGGAHIFSLQKGKNYINLTVHPPPYLLSIRFIDTFVVYTRAVPLIPKKDKAGMQKLIDFLAKIRSLVTSLAVTVVVIALVVILFRQLGNEATMVEPIKVPDGLSAMGYTPEVTAQWLVDEIRDIQRQATTRMEGTEIAAKWQQFDMEVPGAGLSLGTIGRAVRESLGMTEQNISGEIVAADDGYRMRIRLSGEAAAGVEPLLAESNVDALIRKAAERAVRLEAPFMYASYLHASNLPEEALEATRYCLANQPSDDDKWAWNLQGILLFEGDDWDDAQLSYEKALELDPEFALARHNLANVLYQQFSFESAWEELQRAVGLQPELYNAPKEAAFRVALGRTWGGRPELREQEIEMYRLALEADPDNAQAYMWWGIALMQGADADFNAATRKFEAATEHDDENAMAWEKWGQALEQLGNRDAAIAKYKAAIERDREGSEKRLQARIEMLSNP